MNKTVIKDLIIVLLFLATIIIVMISMFNVIDKAVIKNNVSNIDTQNKLGIIHHFENQKIGPYYYTRLSYENNQYLIVESRVANGTAMEIIKLN